MHKLSTIDNFSQRSCSFTERNFFGDLFSKKGEVYE
jgi:hypothetical protein